MTVTYTLGIIEIVVGECGAQCECNVNETYSRSIYIFKIFTLKEIVCSSSFIYNDVGIFVYTNEILYLIEYTNFGRVPIVCELLAVVSLQLYECY